METTGSVYTGSDDKSSVFNDFQRKKPIRIDAKNIRCNINGTEYEWCGGFGAILQSVEVGVKLNEVRMIGNTLFHAYLSYPTKWWSKKRKISWSIPDVSIEQIREIRNAIFGTY